MLLTAFVMGSMASDVVTTNGGTWASFTPTYNCTVADGATAYIVTGTHYTSASGTETIDCRSVDVMMAGKGYFIKGAEANKSYAITASAAQPDDVTGNMIVGCTTATTLPVNNTEKDYAYVLGHQELNGTMRYGLFSVTWTAVTVPAGKAYLQTVGEELNARFISLDPDDNTTSISAVCPDANAGSAKAGKYIKDGRLVIVNDGKEYTLAGQQL